MSKKDAQKNIKLSLEFDTYVSHNPKVLDSLPRGSHIIVVSSGDKRLSDENLKMARNSRSGKFVVASKEDSHWNIKPLSKWVAA
ncbi:hypothetical protein HY968_04830 [Candidatus Kaiserbacteria bacterium]|nr:hypothetical protein [Candidatus Kaiserbacteria bacterium]